MSVGCVEISLATTSNAGSVGPRCSLVHTHTHTHARISKQQNHQQDRFNSTADIDNYVTVSSKMDFLTNSAKSAFHIYLMCSQP